MLGIVSIDCVLLAISTMDLERCKRYEVSDSSHSATRSMHCSWQADRLILVIARCPSLVVMTSIFHVAHELHIFSTCRLDHRIVRGYRDLLHRHIEYRSLWNYDLAVCQDPNDPRSMKRRGLSSMFSIVPVCHLGIFHRYIIQSNYHWFFRSNLTLDHKLSAGVSFP